MRRLLMLSALLLTTVLSLAQEWKPQDISGLYSFVHSGETVQINVQPDGRVSGYISRVANGDSDRGQILDMLFDKASLQGDRLTFQTKKIHGSWFEFKGRVERGKGKTHDEESYFVIRGELTTVSEDANGKPVSVVSEAEFKSFPGGM